MGFLLISLIRGKKRQVKLFFSDVEVTNSVTDCSGGKYLIRGSNECFCFKMTGTMTKDKKPPQLCIMFYYIKQQYSYVKIKAEVT